MMIEYASLDRLIGTRLGNYHLEQSLGQGKWGPVFLARTDTAETTYLLRILAGSTAPGVKARQAYLERFQHQASQIAALQHLNILPLLDYGIYQGMPYLVSPYIAMRSLRTRLAKNRTLDVVTVGRYLDQIAATLEYAHQRGVLHGNLSVDCISIRLDGQLVVADFGVVSLLSMDSKEILRNQFDEWSGTCAPEQLLGKPIGAYTDVYALGSVLYALLTGSPVFPGNTPEEVAQQHLYASPPLLSQWRNDLPAGLYSIIARALAKDPTQRYRQPGVLANAYHRIVDPHNRSRVPFSVNTSPAEQDQLSLASATSLPGMHFAELSGSGNVSITVDRDHEAQRPVPQTAFPHDVSRFSKSDPLALPEVPRPSLMRRFQRRNSRRDALIVVLIVLLLAASTVGIIFLARQSTATSGVAGQVTFFEDPSGPLGDTDALTINTHGLDAPPAGFQYDAWFINDYSEGLLPLGTLTAEQNSFSLTFHEESNNGQASSNLLAAGDKLEITLEKTGAKLPEGKVILVGTFPSKAFEHIGHLLVGYPDTPGKIALLAGMLDQLRLLNIQADALQNLAASRDTVAVGCVAQSIIDISEGMQKGSHYHTLPVTCAPKDVIATGDGFGLLGQGYLLGATDHATYATQQPDATSAMRLHAGLMAIALSNIKGWVTTIDQDALNLHKDPTDLTKVQEIATLADAAYHGVDANGDGQIDPVAGEAGGLMAYLQGQLMSTLSLAPAS
jgi:serine/threonine protein kinase